MNKKLVLAILIILLVIGVTYFVRMNQSLTGGTILKQDNEEEILSNRINLDKLSTHNKESDCWVSYDGKVYDITSFLPKHPGAAKAIAPYCGTAKEFQDAFIKKHGTSKVDMLMKVGVFMGDFDVIGKLN